MRSRYSFLALVALAACANQRFYYSTQAFFTPQEGLNAQAFDHASIKTAVPPADRRVGGSIKFILPTRERIKATGITNPAATTPQGIEYLITSSDRSYELMAELVRQRGAFDSVKIERRFDTASSPAAESTTFVVWLELPQPGVWSWYIQGPSATKQQVALDTSVPRPVPWTREPLNDESTRSPESRRM